jgi:hypothetical protein
MPAQDNTIRPFHVGFPEAELTELRRPMNATRWPERETVTDDSQGVPLATMPELPDTELAGPRRTALGLGTAM